MILAIVVVATTNVLVGRGALRELVFPRDAKMIIVGGRLLIYALMAVTVEPVGKLVLPVKLVPLGIVFVHPQHKQIAMECAQYSIQM